MEPGGGPEPNTPKPAGSAVEFNYSLRAPAFENKLVEAGAACKATLKTGALAPELDALLDAVGTKGKARCKVGIPWQGSAAPQICWQQSGQESHMPALLPACLHGVDGIGHNHGVRLSSQVPMRVFVTSTLRLQAVHCLLWHESVHVCLDTRLKISCHIG